MMAHPYSAHPTDGNGRTIGCDHAEPRFEIDTMANLGFAIMASAPCIALFSFRSWDAVSTVFIVGSLIGFALVLIGTLILELVDEKLRIPSLIGAVFLAAGGVLQMIALIAAFAVGGIIPWAIQLISQLAGF